MEYVKIHTIKPTATLSVGFFAFSRKISDAMSICRCIIKVIGGMYMVNFLFKRLGQFIIVLLVASVIIFILVRLSQVDPVSVILGGKQSSTETVANLRAKFGLDRPVIEQYFTWITGMLRGDFGFGYKYQQPVSELIAARIPITFGLVFIGSLTALILAIPMGVISALKQNSPIDTTLSMLALILGAAPSFLISIIMIMIVAKVAPSFPVTGNYSSFGEYLQRLSLPSLALTFSMLALASRVTRSGMIEQIQAPYVQTAKAKGVPLSRIITRHALKNAVIPLIAVISLQIGNMIVGAVLVENVFSLAGLGSLLVAGIKSSDYPIVQGITMLLVFIFLVISTLADIIYAVIDPRIRQSI